MEVGASSALCVLNTSSSKLSASEQATIVESFNVAASACSIFFFNRQCKCLAIGDGLITHVKIWGGGGGGGCCCFGLFGYVVRTCVF